MPEYTACLDAGDAYHTFTLKNSFKPIMKKQADRSNINASKTPDSGGRSSKNGEIEAYLAGITRSGTTPFGDGRNIAVGRTADSWRSVAMRSTRCAANSTAKPGS